MITADGSLHALLRFFETLPLVTQILVGVILIAAVVFHLRYNHRVVTLGPTILTTLGIFATFVGIACGLSQFDPTSIQASIPALLGGLKTAFWASVFGVGAALTLKLREFVFGAGGSADDPAADEVTAADLVRHLRNIREALNGGDEGSLISQIKLARQDANERMAPLKDIHRGLLGGEDGSLLTQVRLLRQDANDRLDALRDAQAEALRKLSEMGSAALVEALRDVIRDFNQNISEQFGDNFKELNSAVGQLLIWQEHYKETIETTVSRLDEVGRLVGKASDDYGVLVERSGRFAQVAEDLGGLLAALEAGERRLTTVTEGLASLLLSASGSLPEIETKILELTMQMSNAVQENQRTVNAALTDNATAIRMSVRAAQEGVAAANTELGRELTGLAAGAKQQVAILSEQLAAIVTENQRVVGAALNDNAAAIRTSIQSAHQSMTTTNTDFNQQVADLVAKTKEQVATLDAALTTELTRSLESLARQFTALSERFTRDYGPLADRLRQIVELGRVPA